MLADPALHLSADEDHAALYAACEPGTALCTIVGIEGSFSRRVGAQLAIRADGSTVGSLSDGCLEAQLATDVSALHSPEVVRYGRGSPKIDFRLPCGGGLDILLDPAPDRNAIRAAVDALEQRDPASLVLPAPSPLARRTYIPRMQLNVLGEGPELAAVTGLCAAMGVRCRPFSRADLVIDQAARGLTGDRWTAGLLLFHDHEWEAALLEQALASQMFYIGAQGGENARVERAMALAARGVSEEDRARIRSPIGLIPGCKNPTALALSALAEIVGEYEQLRAAA